MSCTCDRVPIIGAHEPGELGCEQTRNSAPPPTSVEDVKEKDAPIPVDVYNVRLARPPKIEVNDKLRDAADKVMDCILTHGRACTCSRMEAFMIVGVIAKAQ